MKAFMFVGQGSQDIGMGYALSKEFPIAKATFHEVDEALGETLSVLMWEGDKETLTLTRNAQPALMAVSVAVMRVLEVEGFALKDQVAYLAGHSLGEYSALVAAGSLDLADAARLLRLRGEAMQDAVPEKGGAMAAIIGLEFPILAELVKEVSDEHMFCEPANDNGGGQIVISGHREAVLRAMDRAKDKGAKRAIPLEVSAPFHSSLMEPAAKTMKEALLRTDFREPSIPIINNVDATPCQDPILLKEKLVSQITSLVRWRQSMLFLAQEKIYDVVEIGVGKVLSGLAKRIDKGFMTYNLHLPEEIKEFLKDKN